MILLIAPAFYSQTAEELHTKIRAATDNKRSAEALSELSSFEKKYPELFTLNNYDYLFARLNERNAPTGFVRPFFLDLGPCALGLSLRTCSAMDTHACGMP